MAVRGEGFPVSSSWHYSMALLTAALLMAFLWSFLRLPEANLLMVTFCFLASSVLYRVPDAGKRFRLLLSMTPGAVFLQWLIGVCREEPVLLVILPSLTAAAILRFQPGKQTACSMCIAGYLAFFAPGGWMPAVDRALEMALGIPVILISTGIFHSRLPEKDGSHEGFSLTESLSLAFLLGAGTGLSEALKMTQGAWIMLTMLFICQFSCLSGRYADASLDRIIATPLGLLLGGLYMECFVCLGDRLIYPLFLFGALSFYLLNRTGSFFLFTIFFMMAFSIYADWSTGDIHPFHFAELLVQRSVATLIGSFFMILYDGMRKKEGIS